MAEDELWDDTTIEEWPETTPIKDYYKGKAVFLTGVTGSVGQLILQKLIRLDVGKVYVHIRDNNGYTATDRLHKLCKNVIMKRAMKHNPKYLAKIIVIEGDLACRNLGISERDIDELIKNVQIVFAVGADVRFNQTLGEAVNSNIRSIYDLLKLAERMPRLESFIFMSTAYTNHSTYGKEEFNYVPIQPEVLMNFVNNLDDTTDIMLQKLITPWCNTYTYTKNIAECLVLRHRDKLPLSIIRPSIVIATDRDPMPGWIGNIYGVNGIAVGFGTGVLRILFADEKFVIDVIPGDYVANSTLAVAYFTQLERPQADSLPIYNCVSSTDNPQTWKELSEDIKTYREFPSAFMVWYATTNFEASWTLFKLFNLIYHCLPAFFIDQYLGRRGDKLRLIRIYRYIFPDAHAREFFKKNWKFDNARMRSIYDRMTAEDHKVFPCDVRNVLWREFNRRYFLGIRVLWAKDHMNTVLLARKRAFRLKLAHYALRVVYLSFVFYFWFNLLNFFGGAEFWQRLNVQKWFSNLL